MGVSTKSLLVSLPPQVKPPQKEFMSAVFSADLCALQDRCILNDEQVQTVAEKAGLTPELVLRVLASWAPKAQAALVYDFGSTTIFAWRTLNEQAPGYKG